MVISRTSAVAVIIQAVSPASIDGASCARAGAAEAASTAAAPERDARLFRYFIEIPPGGSSDPRNGLKSSRAAASGSTAALDIKCRAKLAGGPSTLIDRKSTRLDSRH